MIFLLLPCANKYMMMMMMMMMITHLISVTSLILQGGPKTRHNSPSPTVPTDSREYSRNSGIISTTRRVKKTLPLSSDVTWLSTERSLESTYTLTNRLIENERTFTLAVSPGSAATPVR